jgi:RNA polymerase sigma-70 factor (ECF subfamily)
MSLKSSLQEKIIFLKLRSGDSDAFAFLYDKYIKRIYRFVMIKVSNRQIAEDLTQDIFLKTWQHIVDKRQIKSFQAFIFRIARNSVIDYYRQIQYQELPLDYVSETAVAGQDLNAGLDKNLDKDNLLKRLRKLKPEYQEILLLRYLEDLSIEEMSEVLQKDKNNIRVLLHRALSKLKELSQESK